VARATIQATCTLCHISMSELLVSLASKTESKREKAYMNSKSEICRYF